MSERCSCLWIQINHYTFISFMTLKIEYICNVQMLPQHPLHELIFHNNIIDLLLNLQH